MALIVAAEDDADVADLLATTLGREGHTVRVVPSGRHMLELIAEQRPDLVILDHKMPGLSGLDVARRLRADPATADLPMLMLSAFAPEAALDVFDRVLRIPVSLLAVADAARELLNTTGRRSPVTLRPLTDPDRITAVAELLGDPHPLDDLDLTLAVANTAAMAGARTAAVGLVLNDTMLTVAGVGLPDLVTETGGMPIEWTPCGVVAGSGRAVLVDDLGGDPVYRDTPLHDRCGLRSYAGVPLRSDSGLVVGTLSVMDAAPAAFTTRTLRRLTAAAPDVLALVGRRRRRLTLR